jgi:hypothetical protein
MKIELVDLSKLPTNHTFKIEHGELVDPSKLPTNHTFKIEHGELVDPSKLPTNHTFKIEHGELVDLSKLPTNHTFKIEHGELVDLSKLPQKFNLKVEAFEWIAPLGRAITCFIIFLTAYISHLFFSSAVGSTIYDINEILHAVIHISIAVVVMAVCWYCAFGAIINNLLISKMVEYINECISHSCLYISFLIPFLQPVLTNLNIIWLIIISDKYLFREDDDWELNHFEPVDMLIIVVKCIVESCLTIGAFIAFFAPVIIVIVVCCQNIFSFFYSVNIHCIADQIVYFVMPALIVLVVKNIYLYKFPEVRGGLRIIFGFVASISTFVAVKAVLCEYAFGPFQVFNIHYIAIQIISFNSALMNVLTLSWTLYDVIKGNIGCYDDDGDFDKIYFYRIFDKKILYIILIIHTIFVLLNIAYLING